MGKFSINKVIRTLIGADLVFLSALGFVNPIFAIFITGQIKGGSIEVIGFTAAIYWITKSILEIPIGRFLDKRKGEKDDLHFLVIGYLIVACVHFGYLFSYLPWHIYFLQGIYAVGLAMSWPAWYAIFTRHVDKGKEGLEWSVQDAAYGIGTGITGAVGGILVTFFGFNSVFMIAGTLAIIGALLPLLISKNINTRERGYFGFLWKK
jgi:MFS family permease